MFCLKHGPFTRFFLGSMHAVAVLFLTHSCEGQTSVIGPSSPIVVMVSEDVVLPCHLEPAVDAGPMILEWGRPDLSPRFVHVWHEGQDLLTNQNPSYKGRTSLSTDGLKRGDVSLTLSKVKLSDNGTYRCFFPKQNLISTVQLVVGAVSLPVIAGINIKSSGVVLECRSSGWYPEPEVSWLDAEGNLLSAGRPETVRGPDGFYTVSSRVTVEKRHGDAFTCRLTQNKTNQTTETHIHVSAEYFTALSHSSAARVSILLLVVFTFVIALVLIVWKRQQNKTKTSEAEQRGQSEQLMAESKNMEDSKDNVALNKEEGVNFALGVFTNQKEEVQKWIRELKHQRNEMDGKIKYVENEVESIEKKSEHDKANGYVKLKGVLLEAKKKLAERKRHDDNLILEAQELVSKTESVISEITQKRR